MRSDGVDVTVVVPPVQAPATPVPGVVVPAPPASSATPLPRTGAELTALLLLAVVLLALGASLVQAGRQRRRPA